MLRVHCREDVFIIIIIIIIIITVVVVVVVVACYKSHSNFTLYKIAVGDCTSS